MVSIIAPMTLVRIASTTESLVSAALMEIHVSGSDETGTTIWSSFVEVLSIGLFPLTAVTMIRLAPRRTSPEVRKGRLEIFVNGEWGTVSNDSFNINAANVACRQLRFSGAITHSSAGIEG